MLATSWEIDIEFFIYFLLTNSVWQFWQIYLFVAFSPKFIQSPQSIFPYTLENSVGANTPEDQQQNGILKYYTYSSTTNISSKAQEDWKKKKNKCDSTWNRSFPIHEIKIYIFIWPQTTIAQIVQER